MRELHIKTIFLSLLVTFVFASNLGHAQRKASSKRQVSADDRRSKVLNFLSKRSSFNRKHVDYIAKIDFDNLRRRNDKVNYYQALANLATSRSLFLMASYFSSRVLTVDPEGRNHLWKYLMDSSAKRPIDDILADLSQEVRLKKAPPHFGSEWNYYIGISHLENKDLDQAKAAFKRVKLSDKHFLAAQYLLSTIAMMQEDTKNEELALRTMLNASTSIRSDIDSDKLNELKNHAILGLARFYYKTRRFRSAIKFYRALDRDSPLFYHSLFEQGWSFFNAGYPNHALGLLHGVDSPFFKDVHNPETSILRAIIYFWMCRYDDATLALSEFTSLYEKPVASLVNYLGRTQLNEVSTYQIFEDMISGVSSRNLAIDRKILNSAAEMAPVMFAREKLAYTLAEESLASKRFREIPKAFAKIYSGYKARYKKEIGRRLLTELKNIESNYQKLQNQSSFLKIELLMSRKEQLLGRELHSESKITDNQSGGIAQDFAAEAMPWKSSELGEYWMDELGYHIYNDEPRCRGGAQRSE